MRKALLSLALLFVATFAIPASVANAQFEFFTGSFGITLSIDPLTPQAYESVVVTADSLFTNISAADVSWYVNDSLLTSGRGITSVRVPVGAPGSKTTVAVRAVNALGGTIAGETVIIPADAEILWEADSLVPPFYKGRTLAGAGTSVRAEAHVRLARDNGTLIAPEDIMYTWRRNGAVASSVSGKGKNKAVFSAPLLFSTDTLSVTAESIDRTLRTEARTTIPSVDTLLFIYEDHPLFGTLYNRALRPSATIPETEVKLAAFPLFADARAAGDKRLDYSWTVNGTPIAEDPNEPDKIIVSSSGDAVRATLQLVLAHTTNWFEAAQGTWNIELASGGIPLGDPFSPFGE